jgi:hypothetical protein
MTDFPRLVHTLVGGGVEFLIVGGFAGTVTNGPPSDLRTTASLRNTQAVTGPKPVSRSSKSE